MVSGPAWETQHGYCRREGLAEVGVEASRAASDTLDSSERSPVGLHR